MKTNLKIDPFTKEEFVPKRSNQLFASKGNRIKHNNHLAKVLRDKLAFIEKPLRRNFIILNEIMSDKKEESFHKEFLKGKGFNFEIASHLKRIDQTLRVVVYNFIIIHDGTDTIKIKNND